MFPSLPFSALFTGPFLLVVNFYRLFSTPVILAKLKATMHVRRKHEAEKLKQGQ